MLRSVEVGVGGRLGQVEKGQEHRVNELVSQQDQTGSLAGFLAMHSKKKSQSFPTVDVTKASRSS